MTDGEAVDSFAHPHQNRPIMEWPVPWVQSGQDICRDALQSAFIFSRERLELQSSHDTLAIGLRWVVYDPKFSKCIGPGASNAFDTKAITFLNAINQLSYVY